MKDMSKTADFSSQNIYFTSFLALVEGFCHKNQQVRSHYLDSLLSSWNLRRMNVRGDGNCLFTSVASSLIMRIRNGDMTARDILRRMHINETQFHDLPSILRRRMVEEWNTNIDFYQGFITDDLSSISHQYLQSGQFS